MEDAIRIQKMNPWILTWINTTMIGGRWEADGHSDDGRLMVDYVGEATAIGRLRLMAM